MTLNDELYSLYTEVWKQLKDLRLPTDGMLSLPFFLEVTESYQIAKLRLVIVGQQTRQWGHVGWGCSFSDDPIRCLQEGYAKKFKELPKGHFLKAAHKLQEKLQPYVPPYGFVWANLFPMSQREGQPSLEVQKQLVALRVLAREILLLKPHAVVFFIGPHYRIALNLMFPAVRATTSPTKQSRIVTLEAETFSLPRQSYWTYHPRWLYYQRGRVLEDTLERLATLIKPQEN